MPKRAGWLHRDAPLRHRTSSIRAACLVLPGGDVLVAEQKVGYVTLLRDDDGDGKAGWINRHIEGLKAPYGLAWRDGKVLVADQGRHLGGAVSARRAARPGAGAADTKDRRRAARAAQAGPTLVGEKMLTK